MASPRPVSIHSGKLVWSGEHWIAYLREPAATADSAMVSLFHTSYSPAGEGNVAWIKIPGQGGFEGICTDNPELTDYITAKMVRKGSSPYEADMPVVAASFGRAGDIRQSPKWVIQTDRHRIVTTWSEVGPPVVAEGSFREETEHFTILFFAATAAVQLDGRDQPGKPYLRDLWKKSIGGDRSSCVFALAETFLEMA